MTEDRALIEFRVIDVVGRPLANLTGPCVPRIGEMMRLLHARKTVLYREVVRVEHWSQTEDDDVEIVVVVEEERDVSDAV